MKYHTKETPPPMQAYTEFRYQFSSDAPRNVRLRVDLRGRKWSLLRKLLIAQSAPAEDPSPSRWVFMVDGQVISMFDAASKTIGNDFNGDTLVELRLREDKRQEIPTPKRKRIPDDTGQLEAVKKLAKAQTDVRTFNLARKLVSILEENQSSFRSERANNGLAHRNVMGILGHISVNIQGIQVPISVSAIVIDTNGSPDPLVWIQQREGTVVMAPFFVPNHVSLLCRWGNNRFLHLDASNSFHPQNAHILSMPNVSLTYIPYQLMDDTNVDDNLAGGNCAMFTGLNAVACILRYREEPVGFAQFWSIFEQVLQKTPDKEATLIRRLTLRNLLYHAFELRNDTRCDNLNNYPFPPEELPFVMLKAILTHYDFSADYVILSFFLDTSLGFHQVSLLGNVFRTMLRDIMERGFISFRVT